MPDAIVWTTGTVTGMRDTDDGVEVTTAEGARRDDAVVGAEWEAVLAAYDRERTEQAASTVALGRQLGAAQVTHGPDWAAMGPADVERWYAGAVTPGPASAMR